LVAIHNWSEDFEDTSMPLAGKVILCIDPNASRNFTIYLLERVGLRVITANSIATGIKTAQTQRCDLYLLNHELLEQREVESCDKLDEFAPRAPILFYSGVLYPYEPIKAIHCRLHGHMVKPVSVCDVQRHAAKLITEWTGPLETVRHILRKSISKQFAPGTPRLHVSELATK
jgi:response regulator RpfG family c-di-GMP phosphodiesterase